MQSSKTRQFGVTAKTDSAKEKAEHGRYGDTEMAHVTPGEIVVPHSVQTPRVRRFLQQAFDEQGVPLERYTVEKSSNSMNPETGEPEYFGGIGKKLKKALGGNMGKIIGAGVGMLVPGVGTALGSAVGGALLDGGSPLGAGVAGASDPSTGSTPAQQTPAMPSSVAKTDIGKIKAPTSALQKQYIAVKAADSPMASNADLIDDRQADLGGLGLGTRINDTPWVSPQDTAVNDALRAAFMNSMNPETGMAEYFDVPAHMSYNRKNPKTGMMEFFDANYYLKQNPDVAKHAYYGSNAKAAYEHYQKYGQKEGRAGDPPAKSSNAPASVARSNPPAPDTRKIPVAFNPEAYLANNPDVAASGMNPLDHYTQYGQKEGRSYIAQNAAPVASPQPQYSVPSGFNPSSYLRINPDVKASGMDASQHYSMYGQKEGRSWADSSMLPTGFNADNYYRLNPDVKAAGVDAGQHFLQYGRTEGRNFSVPSVSAQTQSTQQAGNRFRLPRFHSTNDSTLQPSDTASAITQVSSYSPDRSPRFRSRRFDGLGMARNF